MPTAVQSPLDLWMRRNPSHQILLSWCQSWVGTAGNSYNCLHLQFDSESLTELLWGFPKEHLGELRYSHACTLSGWQAYTGADLIETALSLVEVQQYSALLACYHKLQSLNVMEHQPPASSKYKLAGCRRQCSKHAVTSKTLLCCLMYLVESSIAECDCFVYKQSDNYHWHAINDMDQAWPNLSVTVHYRLAKQLPTVTTWNIVFTLPHSLDSMIENWALNWMCCLSKTTVENPFHSCTFVQAASWRCMKSLQQARNKSCRCHYFLATGGPKNLFKPPALSVLSAYSLPAWISPMTSS